MSTLEDAEKLVQNGDVASACDLIATVLDGHEPLSGGERSALLQALVQHCITLSRHDEALCRARQLAQQLHIPLRVGWGIGLLGPLVCALFRLRRVGWIGRALRCVLPASAFESGNTMAFTRTVQLAFFWHDIRACTRLSLLQLALSRSAEEVRRSASWLGYGYAYAGQPRGLRLLRRTLAEAHRVGDRAMLVETYPLLAIGYQMCGDLSRARRYHDLFQRRYAHESAFYSLLSHTNLLVLLMANGQFDLLATQVRSCFERSFALQSSRYHLQIYGAHAWMLVIEGRLPEALKALELARGTAVQNGDRLDWIIFLRLAALVHLAAGQYDEAERLAQDGLAACRAYGRPRWYMRELRELQRAAQRPGTVTPYRARLLEAMVRYHAVERRRTHEDMPDLRLSRLSEQIAEALSTHFEFDPCQPPTLADLREKLSRTFQTDYVIFAKDLAGLKQLVARDRGIDAANVTTKEGPALRFICYGGGFFLGLACEKTSEFRDELAVGVLVQSIDALSESLIRAAFRLVLSHYVFVHSIRISRDEHAKQQRAAAAGVLAQMLAHDMRRPFGMIRSAITTLQSARNVDEFRRGAQLLFPEIEAAIESAGGLIRDVMDISKDSPPNSTEPTAPETLVSRTLLESLRSYPDADVRFFYDFRHEGSVNVELRNVQRALSNIIVNAIQAMKHRGKISFATCNLVEEGRPFIVFKVGNDGPGIPQADLASLFEPFFTRNKSSGTGLGLAIAHRVVTAHGGTIRCSANQDRAVTFEFTLPASPIVLSDPPKLPAHSADIAPRLADSAVRGAPLGPTRLDLPQIAIVDDSRAFLMGWRTALADSAATREFTSPEAFWAELGADSGAFDRLWAVVTDYRFANSRQTGVTFARELKARRSDLLVFISTSGYLSSREVGSAVDAVLDKGEELSYASLLAAIASRAQPIGFSSFKHALPT